MACEECSRRNLYVRPGHLDRTRTRTSSLDGNVDEVALLGGDILKEAELPVVESFNVGLGDATLLGFLDNLVDDLLRLAEHNSQEQVNHDGREEDDHVQNSESQKETGEETVRSKEEGREANNSTVVGVRTAVPDEKKHDFYLHASAKVKTINTRLGALVMDLENVDDMGHDTELANGVKGLLDVNSLLNATHVASKVPES